jgi:hypothetical protein
MARTTAPPSALSRRTQTLVSRPPPVRQNEREGMNDRGGDAGVEVGSSCTSQNTCVVVVDDDETLRVGEGVSSGEVVSERTMCEVDEERNAPCGPHRGEVQ